jgi:hypothetical protein
MRPAGPTAPKVIQSADVFVDAAGLIYGTDYNGGLYILYIMEFILPSAAGGELR